MSVFAGPSAGDRCAEAEVSATSRSGAFLEAVSPIFIAKLDPRVGKGLPVQSTASMQNGYGADGGARTRMAEAEGFSYQLRFSPPPYGVRGLDYTFTLAFALGAARLVSTPSSCEAWLGIAILQVSPTLSSSTAGVSAGALKLSSSPLCLPVSPRPHAPCYQSGGAFSTD